MKIEKLTENKIRVIIGAEELGENNMNVHSLMTRALETQEIFANILKKAEKEVDFHTDGCKLLIEAFSSLEDVFVFTITKYLPDNDVKKKKLVVKRKDFHPNSSRLVCEFESFDAFCEFCKSVKCLHKTDFAKLTKHSALYVWKDSYYLILSSKNKKEKDFNFFYSSLSEFGKLLSCSEHFESKLLEHGKVIMKKDAIDLGIDFFAC